MIRTLALLLGTCLIAGAAAAEVSYTRTGPFGTASSSRSADDGTFTSTESWAGEAGRAYDRGTTCVAGQCSTEWAADGWGELSSGATRQTTWGDGGSTTVVDGTGPRGQDFGRTITRSR